MPTMNTPALYKTVAALAAALLLALGAQAQDAAPRRHQHRPAGVTELVGDLSAQQKMRVDAINKKSRARIDELRRRKHAVCDSIAVLMGQEGDQSASLDPLFEREAALQVLINREMYAAKVAIDRVLTADQRCCLREACRCKEGCCH